MIVIKVRKIFLSILFFVFAPLTLSLSFFGIWQLQETKSLIPLINEETSSVLGSKTPLELYSSLPPVISSISTAVSTGDARPIIIRKFLEKQNSPIADKWQEIFNISEQYGLDYRLMVGIAQCESNVCKRIPEGSYNCWGFENGDTRFLSWEQAFNQVAKTLKEGYYDKGLISPDEIMPKYAPPQVEMGGPWAKCVNTILAELE